MAYNETAFTGFLTCHHDQIFREQKDLPKYGNQICMSYDMVIKISDNYFIPRNPILNWVGKVLVLSCLSHAILS